MRATTFVVALVAMVSAASATNVATTTPEISVPSSTGTYEPSGMPHPSPNSTTDGNVTHTGLPPSDGAGVALSPAGLVGLAAVGIAAMVGGVAF